MLLPLPSLPLPTTALSQISASFLHHNPLDDSALSSTADLWQPLLPASWQPLLGCSIPKIPIVMSLANAFHSASDHIAQSDRPEWFFPLLLSCMAGASTCVGAAVVFCFSPTQIQRSMSFSLSLAASVMMTVSCISIAPECWHGIVTHEPETADVLVGMPTTTRTTMIVHWWLLVERLLAFGLGCGGYVLLSKLLAAMPDPEHLFLGSSKPLNANDVRPLLEDGEVHDEELRDEPTSAKMKRSPSLESYQSGDSFDSFYDDEISDDDIEMVSPVKVGPTKTNDTHHSQNHRMRRKLTTQSTTASLANDNHRENCAATSGENDPSQEDVVPYDKDASAKQKQKQRSWRVAMLLFFSLLAHNFPEGLCVAASAKESPQLGMTVAIGIFIHNVPEGIAISVPCIAARPDAPWLAFWLASISGLAEPIGAIVALLVLQNTKLELENVLATVAGVMIMVAMMELYPEAIQQLKQQQQQQASSMQPVVMREGNKQQPQPSALSYGSIVWGTLVGMAMMIATEWYLPA